MYLIASTTGQVGFFYNYLRLNRVFYSGKGSQEKARTCLRSDDIFLASDNIYLKNGNYKSTKIYGGINKNVLNSNWTKDNNLYEILSDLRKPYFDLDFYYVNVIEN